MRTRAIRSLAAIVCGCVAIHAIAQDLPQNPDPVPTGGAEAKSDYGLLKRTPTSKMRDLSTDRPDTTESPYTVDAGHFQLEMSLVDYTFDRRNEENVTRRSVSVAPMLLKLGIMNDFDLQIGIDPYTREREKDRTTDERTTLSGFGDITVRTKFNLWGNDSGDTALALMPFVKFPTATGDLGNGKIEGGLIVPLAFDLGNDIGAAVMTEFDVVRDGDNERYTIDWVHTATISVPLVAELSGFVEYAGFANLNHAEQYRAYFDCGLTYGLKPNTQLDCGLRLGLTRASDDLGMFAGISWRY